MNHSLQLMHSSSVTADSTLQFSIAIPKILSRSLLSICLENFNFLRVEVGAAF